MLKFALIPVALAFVLGITQPAYADRDETVIPIYTEEVSPVDSSENHAVVLQEHA